LEPTLAVPKQVREQAEKAKQFYDGQSEGDPQNPQPDPGSGAAVRDPEDPNPNAPPVDSGDDGSSDDTYAQRWRSLQGSYNASMRRNSELEGRINQLQTLISTMASAPAQPQAQPQQDDYRLLSDDEVTDYGEAVDVMRKVSREELTPLVQRLVQMEHVLGDVTGRVVPQVQDIATRQYHSAEQNFWGILSQLVPNWREINDDPNFQGWLLEIDPLTGSSRQAFLERAQQSLDAHRVAQFFMQWTGGGVPQPAPRSGGNGSSPSALEMQVAPGRSRSSVPTARNQKTYTTADIANFYDEVRRGVYKGRVEEKDRLERDIFSAQQEGRIVG
jgi:hypothetical protein